MSIVGTINILTNLKNFRMKKTYFFNTLNWRAVYRFSLSLCFCLYSLMSVGQTVTGTIIDDDGVPVLGATIMESNTSNGTITDIDGIFSFILQDASHTVEISYIGYETKTMILSTTGPNSITLYEGVSLDEVVVTALGISREKKGLTYAVDVVSGDELSRVKDVNVINALAGKTPGLVINKSSSGVGGSTRIVLRGNKSTTSNDPLYVIDGIPMTNNRTGQNGGVFGGGVDSGDGISNINPDDIESMSVLKGASAAALYGSQAANGVILITTKKGKKGAPKIRFTSSYTADKAILLPDLQYRYGQTSEGAEFSWGGAVDATDHVTDYFDTGNTFINSISVSGGTETTTSYFSYSNTKANGILPSNDLARHNFSFRQGANFLDDKLKLNGSINYIKQDVNNRPSGGLYFNPLTGLYFFPRGLDFQDYATNYESYDDARNFNTQNWIADRDIQQNPYWITNRNPNKNNRDRFIASLSTSYQLASNLTLQGRINLDKAFDTADRRVFASTQATLSDNNGRYIFANVSDSQIYGDLIMTYANQITDDIALDVNIGTSHTNRQTYSILADSKNGDLAFANKFGLQYIKNPTAASLSEELNRVKRNAVFASAQIGYQSKIYLDVTARNDWSSALPNTSYFYPSFGLTTILSEMMDMSFFDFAKARVSYAIVGNDVPAYVANPKENRGEIVNGQLQFSTVAPIPGSTLVPEKSSSFEFGIETKSMNNRLGLDFTFYTTNTKNQFVNISAPAGSGFTRYLVNAGNVKNSGIEAALTYDVLDSDNLSWTTGFNFTKNSNEILEVHPEFDDNPDGPSPFFITNEAVNSYGMVIQKGGSFGDIWGEKFARDEQDRIILDVDGKPTKAGLGLLGNPNPDFTIGWYNTLEFGNFNVTALIDGRFGGKVVSITQALLDEFGVSEATAAARDAGSVAINAVDVDGNAVSSIAPEVYYGAVGGRQGISEAYAFDATNVRLRELSIGYSFPSEILGTSASLSLIGRNLFFFKNDAPYDPDVTASTGVGLQGIDIFSLPTTRSLGVSLTLDF